MSGIFITYRRDDSQGFAGRLEDDLSERFGDASIFRDREITPGEDKVITFAIALGVGYIAIREFGGPELNSIVDRFVARTVDTLRSFTTQSP